MIHKAASLGHAEVLMLLLERTGAKPDIPNASLATPLHLACKNNRIDSAKFLVGCGVDANAQDEHGQMPLLICCIHGHYDLAKMLIDASLSGHLPEPLEADHRDHRGLSPLNCAAIKGDFDMTRLLLINAQASVDGQSPRGCTPLLYAARGGYAEVVRFLLYRGASPLRQDNAGGTVLHHAIEKGHMSVLNVLQEFGVDMLSAIEIPDNAGRTPIYEAIDNHEDPTILKMLTKSRKNGGFEAKVNISNYNGQTPLFAAAREGSMALVKCLVDECKAKVDLTQGELVKDDYDDHEGQFDSLEEKFFVEAYKNCMTPLHVAVVLGNEDIMLYLIENGANPNLQTKIKGYSCLHLAVLANKPEIIIELLTKTQANPYLPDFGGRTLQDMVEIFIPSYIESFKSLLENLQALKFKGDQETSLSKTQPEETLEGLTKLGAQQPVVVTHYYNPDDERLINGVGADENKMKELYTVQVDGEQAEADHNKENDQDYLNGPMAPGNQNQTSQADDKKKFSEMKEEDIEIEEDAVIETQIEQVFGTKVARAVIALDWKIKEHALKVIFKNSDKLLDMSNNKKNSFTLEQLCKACVGAVSLTCKEKVIKVFTISLQLLNLLISAQKIEKSGCSEVFKNALVERNIVLKLLQKSEEGNTRITNKIHESLLDLSFNPEIGEALASSFLLQRIQAHNRANAQKQALKRELQVNEQSQEVDQREKIQTETQLGSFKGLLAQLALLYKFINSFGIASKTRGPLSVRDILKSVIPTIQHQNQDVRNAATKILIDVHKFSGCVNEEALETLNEKVSQALLEKLKTVAIEKNLEETNCRVLADKISKVNQIKEEKEDGEDEEGNETDKAEVPETISSSPTKDETKTKELQDLKDIVEQKGQKKDWQEKELALKAVTDIYQIKHGKFLFNQTEMLDSEFLQSCLILLKTCLDENNGTLYLLAVEATSLFFKCALDTEVVRGSIQSLITSILLRTTDTNTRIRKRSVDLINQIWDHKPEQQSRTGPPGSIGDKLKFTNARDSLDNQISECRTEPTCNIIAQVICEPQHGEKAIIGRLGLFIKRAQQIEGDKDLMSKPLQMILGRNYEQLTEFACQWVTHKNTKVRQNALKLIIEVCRINCMDPRGQPFKQRIVNYILGLRSSQRDFLVTKINDSCSKAMASTKPGSSDQTEASTFTFINVSELELTVATKGRAASMDHVTAKRRLQSASRGSKRADGENTHSNALLPSIGGVASSLASGLGASNSNQMQPIIVLPHSEPLTEEQKKDHESIIELFGIPIVTCFLSKTWATRMAAIEKIMEQLHNLDPHRRDAMSAEINTKNMPPELTFKTLLELMLEGIKDPVLKNYLKLLELFQQSLPTFFRYIKPQIIQQDLKVIIVGIIRKTADMKQKIRESSLNFCLYLSHQSPIGPEYMINVVLQELDDSLSEKAEIAAPSTGVGAAKKQNNVIANFGNSHMIVSCLNLLNQYQNQSKILEQANIPQQNELLDKFMSHVNSALRHQNPQVRKEAEKLFKTLYLEFGQNLESKLTNQKQQIQQKLIESAKLDALQNPARKQASFGVPQKPNQMIQQLNQEKKVEHDIQRAHEQIRDKAINLSQLSNLIEGSDEHLQALKVPNPKKRLKAVVELKKLISKKIVAQINCERAVQMLDPLLMLIRHLMQDQDQDVYLESLNLLKYIVGSLSPHLSTLDLHLMLGSFIGIIVNNSLNQTMKIQIQTDKVIIYFAKHQNIGSIVIAREIIKSINKLNAQFKNHANQELKPEVIQETNTAQIRFHGILQLLLQQFSIVLCYQQDFYTKCLECLADTMISVGGAGGLQSQLNSDTNLISVRNVCTQIIHFLYAVDYKLLDQSVTKLDSLSRKTPLRKIIIEYETQTKQGKNILEIGKQQQSAPGACSTSDSKDGINLTGNKSNKTIDQLRDTQMSFASSTRQSLFSPGSHATRGMSPGGFGQSQYGADSNWGRSRNNDRESQGSKFGDQMYNPGSYTQTKRMQSLGEGAVSRRRNPGTNQSKMDEQYLANHPISTLTQNSWRRQQDVLPALPGGGPGSNLNRTGVLLPKIDPNGFSGNSFQFDAGNSEHVAKTNNQVSIDNSKFKLKSTGGAGFSSGITDSQSATQTSTYEPTSASRRTPRRMIAAKINNSNAGIANIGSALVSQPSQGASISAIGGIGGSQSMNWQSSSGKAGQQQNKTMESTIGSSSGFTQFSQGGPKSNSVVKPPLYVPTKREGSNNNRRSSERNNSKVNTSLGGDKTADGYISKTGFSSMNIMPVGGQQKAPAVPSKEAGATIAITNISQVPYEQPNQGLRNGSKNRGVSNAASSVFANFGANAPAVASTKFKGFTKD